MNQLLKKILILFPAFFLVFISVSGQDKHVLNYQVVDQKRLHFGFTIGLNSMDFSFKRNSSGTIGVDITQPSPGFNVNIVSELRFNNELALRLLPGLVFGQRPVRFYKLGSNIAPGKDYGTIQLESNYIDVPLLFKYSADRINNFRPYLIAGGSFKYDMAAKKQNQLKLYDDNGIQTGTIDMNLKPLDYFAEIGVGFDFYLTFFKLSTEIKFAKGLRNVLAAPMPDVALENISSNVLLLNFHFE